MHWVSVRLHETGVIRREGLEARGGGGGDYQHICKNT